MSDYKYVCITDVCSSIFAGGDAPKSNFSHELTEECCYPIFSNGESNSGLYGYTNTARVTEPSITVSARGTIGYTAIRLTPFTPIVRLISITPIQSVIDIDYLYYALTNYNPKNTGTSIPQLTVPMIKEYKFKLPERAEQKRAVKALKQLDSILEKEKKQIQKLDTLVKSRFVEMFGDVDLAPQNANWTLISEIGDVVGGSTPKTSIPEYWDGEYRWISPAELKEDSGIIYDSVKKITKSGIDSCSLQELPVGTVILSSRAPIGKVAIAGNTFYCNQGFKNIICNEKVLPRYLYTLLLYNTDYLNSLGRGATFKEISKSIVENIRVPLPTIELQQQFIAFVSQIDKSKLAVQKSLEKLETLKKSLMQEYFG